MLVCCAYAHELVSCAFDYMWCMCVRLCVHVNERVCSCDWVCELAGACLCVCACMCLCVWAHMCTCAVYVHVCMSTSARIQDCKKYIVVTLIQYFGFFNPYHLQLSSILLLLSIFASSCTKIIIITVLFEVLISI